MGIVVKSSSSNWTDFHITTQIINHSSIEGFERPLKENWDLNNKLGFTVSKLVEDLMNVEGVVQIWLHPYMITVVMAQAFTWDLHINRLIKSAVDQLERGINSVGKLVRVETHPNLQQRSFHITQEVSLTHLKMFDRPLAKHNQSDLDEVGKLGEKIIRSLFSIPGVTRVSISPYEIGVGIGKAFDWDDIEARVSLAILVRLV